jgi:hypothetical protein
VVDILRRIKTRPATLSFATSPDGIVIFKNHEWPPHVTMAVSHIQERANRNSARESYENDEQRRQENKNQPIIATSASSSPSPCSASLSPTSPSSSLSSYIVVTGFSRVPSLAKHSKQLELYDIVVNVNGVPVRGHLPTTKTTLRMRTPKETFEQTMRLLQQAMQEIPDPYHQAMTRTTCPTPAAVARTLPSSVSSLSCSSRTSMERHTFQVTFSRKVPDRPDLVSVTVAFPMGSPMGILFGCDKVQHIASILYR